jgi:hypothetical protein
LKVTPAGGGAVVLVGAGGAVVLVAAGAGGTVVFVAAAGGGAVVLVAPAAAGGAVVLVAIAGEVVLVTDTLVGVASEPLFGDDCLLPLPPQATTTPNRTTPTTRLNAQRRFIG